MTNGYAFGFAPSLVAETFPKGLCEEVIRSISAKRNESAFWLNFRLEAFFQWQKLREPHFANVTYPPIDYQDISYYSALKDQSELPSTLEQLHLPVADTSTLALDVVFDSACVQSNFHERLQKHGVIFCSISEAMQRYPELVERYLGTVVPKNDNYFAALNAAVFSDGSFVYIPKGVRCPIDLSTYFRIHAKEVGQFERTLIIADEGSYVSYLEGCTAPAYDTNQLHAAVVEIIAHAGAEVRYSTVQNWYPGDPQTGKGGIYNFVTKRGLCEGDGAKIRWTQVEIGSAKTWKYPSCILQGAHSVGEFYSVALTHHHMQADTGTKMIHLGEGTRSSIIAKGISADESIHTFRGQVVIGPKARNAKNVTQCDSLLVGENASAHTFPLMKEAGASSSIEHEASVSRLNEEELFYLQTRGFSKEEAISLIVHGFCRDVMELLPYEFAEEAKALLSQKLEGCIG